MKTINYTILVISFINTLYGQQNEAIFSEKMLIRKYAPFVYFHPKECYFPCGVGWFVNQCAVWKLLSDLPKTRINLKPKELVAHVGAITPDNVAVLGQYTQDYHFLKPKNKEVYYGEPLVKNTSSKISNLESNAPCYAHLFKKGSGEIVIQYLFFYAYNGPTVDIGLVSFGSHVGDWEHIDVHLNRDLTIKEVYLAAHGSNNFGSYVAAKDLNFYEKTHPIIYSALSGHSSYSKEIKYFNKAFDQTGKGATWNTQHTVINVNDPGQEWINFKGQWGNSKSKSYQTEVGSPQTPSYQSWWRERPKNGLLEIAKNSMIYVKGTTQAHKKSKIKQITTFLSSSWQKQHDKPHHSKLFDLEGKIPTRSKNLFIVLDYDPAAPLTITSFSIYQERLLHNDKALFTNIQNTDQGAIVTLPKFDSSRKDQSISLKNLYITDIKIKNPSNKNKTFIINIYPLEA